MFHNCTVTPFNPLKRRSKSLDDIKQDKLFPYYQSTIRPDIPRRRHSFYTELNHLEYSRLATIYGWITTSALLDIAIDELPIGPINRESNTPKKPIENDPHVFDLLWKDSANFIHYGKSDTTVTSATVEKLVDKLTREMDQDFLMDFFLTFRQFVTPIKLFIRHWLTHYWTFDFIHSRTLRFMLCTFLTQLRTYPVISYNERIVKSLRRILKRQRRFHRELQGPELTTGETKPPQVCRFRFKLSQNRLLSFMHPNQQSIILRYRSEVITQQFCLIERDMLQTVSWDELVELRWRKKRPLVDSLHGVEQLIDFFNKTCQWVACEIVRYTSLDTRVKIVEKFIRIAYKCLQHRNYSTLMQILLGLQSPTVTRLERTWEKVDISQKNMLDQLKELSKPFRNWKNMRECMTRATQEVTESFAVECVLTQSLKEFDNINGSIPFLGLYLSDLVFLAELPTFVNSTADEYEEEEEERELRERLCNHLVNYNKFRIMASVVKHVLTFQVLSRAYRFKANESLFTQLQKTSVLDNSQLREASFLCER